MLATGWTALGAETQEGTAAALRAFGLDIPPGPLTPGQGQGVTTAGVDGAAVVGKLLVTVGDNGIVMLPDGQLVVRSVRQFEATEQPFEAASKAALAAQLRSDALADFRTKETRRYLYLYNCSEPFAEAASRILETMFRGVVGYAQTHEIPVSPPEVPLVVILFRTAAEFQKFRRMPEDTVAYY